ADPDFVEARYQANSDTPPAHTGNDPEFVLNQQGSSTKTVSPTLQGPNTTLVPWVASEQNGNPILYDATSARDVAANAGSGIIIPVGGANYSESNWYDDAEGYASYLHNNMFVTRFTNGTNAGGIDSTWQYQPGIRYVDWQGNWWQAWYQDGTFLHVKI